MAYNKTNWQSLPSTDTPVNVSNLNKIENGIYNNSMEIENMIKNDYSVETTKGYSANYINNNFQTKATLLWTNSNPSSSFSTQTITLSSSDYDVLEVYYKEATNTGTMTSTKLIKLNNSILAIPTLNGLKLAMFTRNLSFTNATTIKFYDGWKRGSDINIVDNTVCIPLYIVGYKTGLFD